MDIPVNISGEKLAEKLRLNLGDALDLAHVLALNKNNPGRETALQSLRERGQSDGKRNLAAAVEAVDQNRFIDYWEQYVREEEVNEIAAMYVDGFPGITLDDARDIAALTSMDDGSQALAQALSSLRERATRNEALGRALAEVVEIASFLELPEGERAVVEQMADGAAASAVVRLARQEEAERGTGGGRSNS